MLSLQNNRLHLNLTYWYTNLYSFPYFHEIIKTLCYGFCDGIAVVYVCHGHRLTRQLRRRDASGFLLGFLQRHQVDKPRITGHELSESFTLIWVPNSGRAASNPGMGYDPVYWFTNHNSAFGTEAQLRSMIKTFKAKGFSRWQKLFFVSYTIDF